MNIIMEAFNIFTPVFLGLGVALGIALGFLLSKPKKNQIFKILPEDRRGYDFPIIEENAFSVYAKGFDTLPDQRFIKFKPSILVKTQKAMGRIHTIARYIGREGTAYTQRVWGNKISKISLSKTLKALWGEEQYDRIPAPLRAIVEKDKVGITIELSQESLTPNDPTTGKPMSPMSEEDIKTETDRKAAKTLWEGKELHEKGQWVRNLAWIGCGFGICIVVALLMNWIQIK